MAQSIPFDISADPDDDYEHIVLESAQKAKKDKTVSQFNHCRKNSLSSGFNFHRPFIFLASLLSDTQFFSPLPAVVGWEISIDRDPSLS